METSGLYYFTACVQARKEHSGDREKTSLDVFAVAP
jgi:hypothetical protein